MTRRKILIYIFLDLILIAGAGFQLWTVYQRIQREEADKASLLLTNAAAPAETPTTVENSTGPVTSEFPAPETSTGPMISESGAPAQGSAPLELPTATAAPLPVDTTPPQDSGTAEAPAQSPKPAGAKRAVTFRYVHPTAKSVKLTGSFTGWTPQSFRKTAADSWSIVVQLAPGEYSYNLIVDGKTIRDPRQPRSDDQGRSLLTVKSKP